MHYLEIGIGNGDCIAAVIQYIKQVPFLLWRIAGVDLPTYHGPATRPETYGRHYYGVVDAEGIDVVPPMQSVALNFSGAKSFLANTHIEPNYVFIDGCHGANCVRDDFLGVEAKVRPGGIVCFHDTDPYCQGLHLQPHCGTGIDARRAVKSLGLLDDTRPGWKKVDETAGDLSRGCHGCLWVQKVP